MKIKIKLDEGAKMPTRAHKDDAGLDIYTPRAVLVYAGSSAAIDTGVHIEIPKGYVGFLKSKSGLNVRNCITGEGVIDSGYTGSIAVKLYNHSRDRHHLFSAGDKIIQLVLLPITTPELEEVKTIEELYGGETDRGDNGFGSSGN